MHHDLYIRIAVPSGSRAARRVWRRRRVEKAISWRPFVKTTQGLRFAVCTSVQRRGEVKRLLTVRRWQEQEQPPEWAGAVNNGVTAHGFSIKQGMELERRLCLRRQQLSHRALDYKKRIDSSASALCPRA